MAAAEDATTPAAESRGDDDRDDDDDGDDGARCNPAKALPPEILAQILAALPRRASTAVAISGVCRRWRDAVLGETEYLKTVAFKMDARRPFKGLDARIAIASAHRRTWTSLRARHDSASSDLSELTHELDSGDSSATRPTRAKASPSPRASPSAKIVVPKLLARAAEMGGNVTAHETLATLRELQGDHAGAYKSWRKAALLGSCVGQFRLGEIFYRGVGNQGVDGEEALFWLQKATKAREAGAASLPSESLGVAAGIMGFLHLDGEGCQACNTTAVKWFKVAADAGNKEASTTLGWMYNTGQY
jgi:TPR repeat protein